MLWSRFAGVRARRNRLNPHEPHQPLHSLTVNFVAQIVKVFTQLATTVKRMTGVFLIQPPHQLKIVFRFTYTAVFSVVTRPWQVKQPALPANA